MIELTRYLPADGGGFRQERGEEAWNAVILKTKSTVIYKERPRPSWVSYQQLLAAKWPHRICDHVSFPSERFAKGTSHTFNHCIVLYNKIIIR